MELKRQYKKLCIIGKNGLGKRMMVRLIFGEDPGYVSKSEEDADMHFMNKYLIDVWSNTARDSHLRYKKDETYQNIGVIVYMFEAGTFQKDESLKVYQNTLKRINDHSKSVRIFVFLHKSDLLPNGGNREKVLEEGRKAIIGQTELLNLQVDGMYETSIWDRSLYTAWSDFFQRLTENLDYINNSLKQLCDVCEYDEIVLFDRQTLLIQARCTRVSLVDEDRFEKICHIIKRFRTTCKYNKKAVAESFQIKKDNCTILIKNFSTNLIILIVDLGSTIQPTSIELNIKQFEKDFNTRYIERK